MTDPTLVTNTVFTPETVLAAQAGVYTFVETILAGWNQTAAFLDGVAVSPLSPTVNVTVAGTSGETHQVLYGNFQCFEVTGRKLNDLDGNGRLDPGESGIAGWGITLLRNGVIYATTTTGADGSYSFTVCEGGVYQVVEEDRDGWAHTSPRQSDSFDGTSGVARGPFDFLNFQCFDVSGRKYNDLNGNGAVDAGEPGIEGWTITLLRNGAFYADTTTGSGGSYSFTVCEGGSYTVQEEVRPDWTPTSPSSVPLGAAESGVSRTADFLNFACFDVTVTKFYDANKDRAFGGGDECTLSGWTFTLSDGTVLVTGPDGTSSAHVCDPGSYSIVEENRSGWQHTTASTVSFNAVSGRDVSFQFGNVQPFVGGLTIGYWKTHTGCMNDGTPVDPIYSPSGVRCSEETMGGGFILLGGLQKVQNAQEAFAVFDGANCSGTCETMLEAQLLGAKLNARRFSGFTDALLPDGRTVGEVIAAADLALSIGDVSSYSNLAAALDTANNNHDGSTLVVDFCAP